MRVMKFKAALAIITVTAAFSCKPPAGSDLDAITGVDELGRKAAFSLVAVRNFSDTKMTPDASSNAGVLRAETLIRMPFFAIVQCITEGGFEAQQTISMVEYLSASNNLFIDKNRALFSFNPAKNNERSAIGCQVVGGRLLTWMVVADTFQRTTGIPETKPSDKKVLDAAADTYALSQAIYLALRGSTASKGGRDKGSAMLSKLVEMADAHEGYDANRLSDIKARFRAGDDIYNPCYDVQASAPWYAKEWKKKNYACVKTPYDANLSNYAAGGVGGQNYTNVRNMLANEIHATHDELYQRYRQTTAEEELWNVLTSTKPWGSLEGRARSIGAYLAGNASALNFRSTFGGGSGGFGLADTAPTPEEVMNEAFGPLREPAAAEAEGFSLGGTARGKAPARAGSTPARGTTPQNRTQARTTAAATVQGPTWIKPVQIAYTAKGGQQVNGNGNVVVPNGFIGTHVPTDGVLDPKNGEYRQVMSNGMTIPMAGMPSLSAPLTFLDTNDTAVLNRLQQQYGNNYQATSQYKELIQGNNFVMQKAKQGDSNVYRNAKGDTVFVNTAANTDAAVSAGFISAKEAGTNTTMWNAGGVGKVGGKDYNVYNHASIPGTGAFKEQQLVSKDPKQPNLMRYEFDVAGAEKSTSAVVPMLDSKLTNGYAVPDPKAATSIQTAFASAQAANTNEFANNMNAAREQSAAAAVAPQGDGTYWTGMKNWFNQAGQVQQSVDSLGQAGAALDVTRANTAGAMDSRSAALRNDATNFLGQQGAMGDMYTQNTTAITAQNQATVKQLGTQAWDGTTAAVSDGYNYLRNNFWGSAPANAQPQSEPARDPGPNPYQQPTYADAGSSQQSQQAPVYQEVAPQREAPLIVSNVEPPAPPSQEMSSPAPQQAQPMQTEYIALTEDEEGEGCVKIKLTGSLAGKEANAAYGCDATDEEKK